MAIPLLLIGGSVLLSGVGISKGLSAKEKNKKAKKIAKKFEQKMNKANNKLQNVQHGLNQEIEAFARFKIDIFQKEIKLLVSMVKECKGANSQHISEKIIFTEREIELLDLAINTSLELTSGVGKGVASGALTAFGVYGTVGALASASTGTAIATLSGVAAENAILAWLGGGAISVGGGGVALGTTVMGGLVAGPVLAIVGFSMDSKAEKNLTEAEEYRSKVKVSIEQIELKLEEFNTISRAIEEFTNSLNSVIDRFDVIESKLNGKIRRILKGKPCDQEEFRQLLILGRGLKDLLDISIMDKEGNYNSNFERELKELKC